MLSGYARLHLSEWRTAAGVPVAAVEAPLRKSVFWLVSFGLLSIGLSALVAGWSVG